MLLLAVASTACSSLSEFPSAFSDMEPGQPRPLELLHWDDRIVARTAGAFYEVDLDTGQATPLALHDGARVWSVTTALGRPWALVWDEGSTSLLSRIGPSEWERIDTPGDGLEGPEDWSAVVGDDDQLVVMGRKAAAVYDGARWAIRKHPSPFSADSDDTICLRNGKVYIGARQPNKLGVLQELTLDTGALDTIRYNEPVVDLEVGPEGALWMATGRRQWGKGSGRLMRFTDDSAEVLLTTGWSGQSPLEAFWEIDHTDIVALDFDPDGRPVVLTNGQGIAALDDDGWEILTPRWPAVVRLESMLVLDGHSYLVGTSDKGLLSVDLRWRTQTIIRFTNDSAP